jgi:hypothetical protein
LVIVSRRREDVNEDERGMGNHTSFVIGSDSGIDVGLSLVWLTCSFGCQNASLA